MFFAYTLLQFETKKFGLKNPESAAKQLKRRKYPFLISYFMRSTRILKRFYAYSPENTDKLAGNNSIHHERKLNNDQTICLNNQIYLIENSIQPGAVISINKDFSGNLTLFCGKIKLSFKLIYNKIKPVAPV
jgi:hypothetical protein